MKKQFFVLLLLLLIISQVSIAGEREKIDIQLEFDQMLQIRFGMTYNFNDDLGIRGSLGLGPLGPTTFSFNLMGVYRFFDPADFWQIDLEIGLPLAYFNLVEGRWVDWDPVIDDPFVGWLPGVSARIGRSFSSGFWGIRLGASYWWEHQRDSGWKDPRIMPIFALIYEF